MNELEALTEAIGKLPLACQQKLSPTLKRVQESHRRRKSVLKLVQDAMSQLRLDMKYLVFDLEATRRERDELIEQDGSSR